MPLPLLPLLATAIPAVSEAIGAMINRGQSRRDIERQNEYNSPINQVRRLNEAGLPMSAMTGNITGNQSALPQTSGTGVAGAGGKIASYITTAIQQQQLELLVAQTKKENAEANKADAESNYLLQGVDEPYTPTNLTRGIALGQGIQSAQKKGAELANQITEVAAENAKTKTMLENTEAMERIQNLIASRQDTFTNIKGKELENAMKEIELRYKPQMSEAEFRKLLADTGLVNSNKTGKDIDNDIQSIRYQIEKATQENQIQSSNIDLALKELTWESTQAYFDNYQQYQEFVQRVRAEMNKDIIPKSMEEFKARLKAAFALAYTTVTGITGQSPNLTNLIKSIK